MRRGGAGGREETQRVRQGRTFRFEHFEVDAAQRLVTVAGRPRALGDRAFDLLMALVEGGDALVPKAALLEAAWPDAAVEENNLAVQIGKLRKLLGAAAIATVAGRGYRLAARLLDDPRDDDLIEKGR